MRASRRPDVVRSTAPVRSSVACSIERTCASRLRSATAAPSRPAGTRRTNVAAPAPPPWCSCEDATNPPARWVARTTPSVTAPKRPAVVPSSRRVERSTRRPGASAPTPRRGRRGRRRGARAGDRPAPSPPPPGADRLTADDGGCRPAAARPRAQPEAAGDEERDQERRDGCERGPPRARAAPGRRPAAGRRRAACGGPRGREPRGDALVQPRAEGGRGPGTAPARRPPGRRAPGRRPGPRPARRRAPPGRRRRPARGRHDGAWQASRRRWRARCRRVPAFDAEMPSTAPISALSSPATNFSATSSRSRGARPASAARTAARRTGSRLVVRGRERDVGGVGGQRRAALRRRSSSRAALRAMPNSHWRALPRRGSKVAKRRKARSKATATTSSAAPRSRTRVAT